MWYIVSGFKLVLGLLRPSVPLLASPASRPVFTQVAQAPFVFGFALVSFLAHSVPLAA